MSRTRLRAKSTRCCTPKNRSKHRRRKNVAPAVSQHTAFEQSIAGMDFSALVAAFNRITHRGSNRT